MYISYIILNSHHRKWRILIAKEFHVLVLQATNARGGLGPRLLAAHTLGDVKVLPPIWRLGTEP